MTEQEKREKVIAEIERIADEANPWKESPPLRCDIPYPLLIDAIALLKAQEPWVMTWEEAQATVNEGPFIIMEVRDSTGTEVDYGVLVDNVYEMSEGSILTVGDFGMLKDEYGKHFRVWTSRPTDAQREAMPWNGSSN